MKITSKRGNGCKRFHVSHCLELSRRLLAEKQTIKILPFKIIVTDYSGPLICKATWNLARAIHLELLPNRSTRERIMVLQRLLARIGRASVTSSDNEKPFVAAVF